MKKAQLVSLENNQALTSSRIVADKFDKRHDNIIRDIKGLFDQAGDEFGIKRMFHEATYEDKYGRQKPMYLMNRDGFSLLAMGFTGKKALQFKLKFIDEFNLINVMGANIMHKEIINGKSLYVADTMEEALVSWFGEETGHSMLDILSVPKSIEQKCVYVLQMSNKKVKIGVAKNFDKRSNMIMNSSGMDIINRYHTELMPSKTAFAIETSLHRTFAPWRLNGEYFDINFDVARIEAKKLADLLTNT